MSWNRKSPRGALSDGMNVVMVVVVTTQLRES